MKLIHLSYILCVHSLLVVNINKILLHYFFYQNEKQKVEKQRDCLQLEVEQLRGDLEVTHNEGAKEERKSKVCIISQSCSVSDVERN